VIKTGDASLLTEWGVIGLRKYKKNPTILPNYF